MATATSKSSSTSMMTLRYGGAVGSALLATFSIVTLLSELFGLWMDKTSGTLFMSGYVGVVTTAVAAVLFSVIAFLLYRQVTKDVATHLSYIETSAYNFITNAFFAVLAAVFVFISAELISILLSSLLLIGTSTDIGALYLGQFLPSLLAGSIVGFIGFTAYKILRGKNFSLPMTIVLLSLSGALLLAVLITVPIKAHLGNTTPNTSDTLPNSSYDQYFNIP